MQKQCLDRVLIFFCLEFPTSYGEGTSTNYFLLRHQTQIHITQGSVFLCVVFTSTSLSYTHTPKCKPQLLDIYLYLRLDKSVILFLLFVPFLDKYIPRKFHNRLKQGFKSRKNNHKNISIINLFHLD